MAYERRYVSWWLVSTVVLAGLALLAGAASALEITRPYANEVIRGNRIELEGTAGRRSRVRLIVQREERKLFGSNWTTVYDETMRASERGRWDGTTSAGGKDGAYRAIARVINDRGQVVAEVVRGFRVETGNFGGSGSSRSVHIDRPAKGSVLTQSTVQFSGTASPNMRVRLHIYGPGGRLAGDETLWVGSSGRWSASVRLSNDGSHSAYADLKDSRGNTLARDSVSFHINTGGDFGGSGSSALYFTTPTRGQTVSSPSVTVAGRGLARREVRVQVFGPGGERVHYEMTRVDGDGRWGVKVGLSREGQHRARAELLDDQGRVTTAATVEFRYGKWGGGSGGSWEHLTVNTPKDGQRLYSTTYGFSGTAQPDNRVRIEVYDSRGKRVFGYSTDVARNGGWYLTVRVPGVGRYRAEVESLDPSGRVEDRRVVRFYYGNL